MKKELFFNKNRNIKFILLSVFFIFLFGCIKKFNKEKSKPIVKNLDTPKKSDEQKIISPGDIYYVETSGFFQRGITFQKTDSHSVSLFSKGPLSSVFVSDSQTSLSVRIKKTLTASIQKEGIGGVIGSLKDNNRQGATIYLVTMSNGKKPALILVPTNSKLTLPTGYSLLSEPLWYISIGGNTSKRYISDFRDFGDGVNHYYMNSIYSERHKVPLSAFNEPTEINRIFSKAPYYARYVILDITVVLKNQRGKVGYFDIIVDPGRRPTLVERFMLAKSLDQRIYKRSIKVPIMKKEEGYGKGIATIKAHARNLTSSKGSDAYVYIYVKGWKKVNHF